MSSPGFGDHRTSQAPAGAFLDFAVEHGFLSDSGADRARAAFARTGQPIDDVLNELGLINEAALAQAQAGFLGLPVIGPESFPETPVPLAALDSDYLYRSRLLPLADSVDALVVASALPLQQDTIRALAFYLDKPTQIRVAVRSDYETAFKRLYGVEQGADGDSSPSLDALDDDLERLKDLAREAPIIRLVNQIVVDAAESGASDIHFEPAEGGLKVRFRIDGALRTAQTLGRDVIAGVVTRIKILAQLNIAERRLPQDGRIRITVRGREIDLRASTTPTLHGEGIVLRILDRSAVALQFDLLGFEEAQQQAIRTFTKSPNGIVLVTGPTGSGKTTTLYAALRELNREHTKIFTVEDPVEHQLAGINQIQVKLAIGLDFVACLRSILRQDPDIIMIGEIRDRETARIAVQAALTGHLVLSTLHTNSAAASITRLLDMGIEDYLVASSVRGIVAQRLLRCVCQACCTYEAVEESLLASLGMTSASGGTVMTPRAIGCRDCHGTGYRGRTTIAEILPLDADVRPLVLKRAAETQIEAHARSLGLPTLRQSGLAKVCAGVTTLEEVLRVTGASA